MRHLADRWSTMLKHPPTAMPELKRALHAMILGLIALLGVFFFDHQAALMGASLPWSIAHAARILTEFGEGQWVIIPAVVLFLYGWRTGRDNLARWAFLLGVTVAVSGGLANALKLIFGRWRPVAFIEGEETGFTWFATGSVRASFPSGHATTAAAASIVLALWFPKWRWPIMAVGVAIATTRVILSMHYPSDVIAGWILGSACVTLALWIWWRVHPDSVPRPMIVGWPRSPAAIAWTAILCGTLVRVLVGLWLPLGIDEAYEVATCQSAVLSGFDHPPLVYWLTHAGLLLSGDGPVDPIWIRTPFILCFALTSWLAWRLGCRFFSPAAGAWTAVLLNLSALFSVALGGWALPDGPLLAALMMMALILARGGVIAPLTEPNIHAWNPYRTWILAGCALGIAALAKYQAILIAIAVLIFLCSTARGRKMLRHPAPWIGAMVALLFTAPILIWNAQNDWASFRFQVGRATTVGGLHPLRLLELLGAQAGIILPWIWAPLIFEWIKSLRIGRANAVSWFLVCLAGFPVLFFLTISLWGTKGLPHWSAVGYLFAFPLLGAATAHELAVGKRSLVRNWLIFSVAILLIVIPVGVSQAANGWMNRMLPQMASVKDPTLEALPWTSVRTYIRNRISKRIEINNAFPPPPPPPVQLTLGTDSSQPCADEDSPTDSSTPPPTDSSTPPLVVALQLPQLTEAFTPPPAKPAAWKRTAPKVTRPPVTPDPEPPLPELDADIVARCGGEGVTTESFFLAGINWRDTGKLGVAVAGLGIPVVCLSADARQFAWTLPQADLQGRDALLIVRSDDAQNAEREYARYFASLAPIAIIRVNRGSSIADQLTVFCAINFDGSTLWRYGQ